MEVLIFAMSVLIGIMWMAMRHRDPYPSIKENEARRHGMQTSAKKLLK